MNARFTLLSLVAVVLVAACTDEPTRPEETSSTVPASFSAVVRGQDIRDVPRLEMDLGPQPAAREATEEGPVGELARADGHVIVAFKEPEQPRVSETGTTREIRGRQYRRGVRAAVSRSAISDGLNLLASQGAVLLGYLDAIGAAYVEIDPAAIPALRDSPLVDYIAPRQWGSLAAQSTDWGMTQVRAPTAWGVTRGAGAKLLIIDSGHQQNHEDLPSIPTANCGGAFGGCVDEELIGWHGTHVLGIATMRDNTIGWVGVGNAVAGSDTHVWGACRWDADLQRGICSTSEVALGIDDGVNPWSVDVISMSLGGPPDTAVANAVAAAAAAEIVMVAAAGNNRSGDSLVFPAAYSDVIGVSGTNPDRSFAGPGTTSGCNNGWSNWGSHVSLAAPFKAWSTIAFNTYDEMCGTSMATPHVAGVAALLRAKLPGLTADSVRNRLFNTAADEGPAGWDPEFGHGIVDATAAVDVMFASMQGPGYIDEPGTYEWEALANGGEGPPYTYAWERKNEDDDIWFPVGGNSSTLSQTLGEDPGPSFRLRVTITAPDAQQLAPEKDVTNAIGTCDPLCRR